MPDVCYRYLASHREGDEVLVLTLTLPELRGETLCAALRQELLTTIAGERAPRVVLDLGEVDFVASLGLAALLNFRRQLRRQGGRLRLCHPSPFLLDLLHATGLTGFDPSRRYPFVVAPNLTTALAQLRVQA
jgi:anti-anti-sigma factor